MSAVLIRHAAVDDYKSIIGVVDEWWGGRRVGLMLPKLFFQHFRQTSFVAVHDGVIVGFVIAFVSQSDREEGYIHFVGVHPSFRKSGLGNRLYSKVFESMTDLGCKLVRCVTSPLNKGSIRFHRRLGFEFEPAEKIVDGVPIFEDYDGPGEDRVLFSKGL